MSVTEPPDRLTGKPSWLVTQLATYARRLVSDAFAEADARGYHYRVLATLHEFGESSQIDLARRCGMDRSDMVAVINELVEAGQVERTQDPDDRRRNLVTITNAGDRQLRRLDRALEKVQDELVAPLSDADRQTLHRLLTEVLRHHQQWS
jgi:MarR family transcriptional regulator, lower aerobic nicotinate degradation pathway regulator